MTPETVAELNREAALLRQKYPAAEGLLADYNPSRIKDIMALQDRTRIFVGSAPHLRTVAFVYGDEVAEGWIEIQLHYLSEFAGARDKLDEQQSSFLATFILSRYGWLRMSEFMFFISEVMCGRFGLFYGTVDAQRIMYFLDYFKKNILRDCYSDVLKAEHELSARKEHSKVYITSAQWLAIRPQVMQEYERMIKEKEGSHPP